MGTASRTAHGRLTEVSDVTAESGSRTRELRPGAGVRVMHEIASAFAKATSLEEVADLATGLVARAIGATTGTLWLQWSRSPVRHHNGSQSDAAATTGPHLLQCSRARTGETSFKAGRPLAWPEASVIETGTSLYLEDTGVDGRGGVGAILPLLVHERVAGVLSFEMPPEHRFSEEERELLETTALQVAQAIDRAWLIADVESQAERRDGELEALESEHKRLYDAERNAREQAVAAMRIRDEFLATVSHELRTPLNAILGWIQLLRTGTVPEDRREHALRVIERNARAQEQLISDLLDVSRVITGRLRLNVVHVQLQEVVDMAIEVVRPSATEKGITLDVHLDHDAPDVLGDPDRLQQVVWNLLTNAVKFTPPGGRIAVTLATELPHIVVSVTDSGKGMAAEFLEYVFHPFRQADASFARKQKGLGLGLAITRSLIEMHAGTVEAHSEGDGKGATFVVRMPVATLRPEATPRVPAFAARGTPRPTRSPVTALRELTVLVVEDEPDSRELLVSLLEQQGATVLAAASVAEALEKLTVATPHILLSDVGLPGEDGLSLIRKVRGLPVGLELPAIALTAFVTPTDKRRAIEAGFDAHIAKPIEPDELLAVMVKLVERGRR